MTQKKSYSRYFIILQEDEKGYALASDKLPSGYAKLEIKNDKCKISYYVQNLKKESAPYFMILICGKKDVKKIIKLGELNIDDYGRAEVSYEYQADNLANCGINVDKVIGAGIVKFMNTNIVSIMSGFASTDIPEWKGFPVVEGEMRRDEPVKENPIAQQSAEVKAEENVEEKKEEKAEEKRNIFDEYEKKIEEEKDKQSKAEKAANEIPSETVRFEDKSESKAETVKEVQEEISQDVPRSEEKIDNEEDDENIEEYGNEGLEEDEARHKKKIKKGECEEKLEKKCEEKKKVKIESKLEEHKKNKCDDKGCPIYHEKYDCKENVLKDQCKKPDKDYPKGNVGASFMEVVKGFEELEGICIEIKRCRWYKVPVYSLEDMTTCSDHNKYNVVYYPMISHYQYIRRFGHFILGYKSDKNNKMKYVVYGIPGTKSRRDQPFGGRSGFVTWVPLREGEEDENSLGYWLMFYDFRTSTIVVPVK